MYYHWCTRYFSFHILTPGVASDSEKRKKVQHYMPYQFSYSRGKWAEGHFRPAKASETIQSIRIKKKTFPPSQVVTFCSFLKRLLKIVYSKHKRHTGLVGPTSSTIHYLYAICLNKYRTFTVYGSCGLKRIVVTLQDLSALTQLLITRTTRINHECRL